MSQEISEQSKELFQLVVEHVEDFAVFVTDLGGRHVSWNRGVERLLGYDEAEWINAHASLIFTPEDRERGAVEWEMETLLLQRAHAHVRNQRADFHHKLSRWLVNNYGLIAVEDLNIKGMANGMLAKSISDAGWGDFLNMIAYKAEEAGRVFVRVNPSGTSQNCCACGHRQEKTLSERRHDCATCGVSLGRDHNAALNILAAGRAVAGIT